MTASTSLYQPSLTCLPVPSRSRSSRPPAAGSGPRLARTSSDTSSSLLRRCVAECSLHLLSSPCTMYHRDVHHSYVWTGCNGHPFLKILMRIIAFYTLYGAACTTHVLHSHLYPHPADLTFVRTLPPLLPSCSPSIRHQSDDLHRVLSCYSTTISLQSPAISTTS